MFFFNLETHKRIPTPKRSDETHPVGQPIVDIECEETHPSQIGEPVFFKLARIIQKKLTCCLELCNSLTSPT